MFSKSDGHGIYCEGDLNWSVLFMMEFKIFFKEKKGFVKNFTICHFKIYLNYIFLKITFDVVTFVFCWEYETSCLGSIVGIFG